MPYKLCFPSFYIYFALYIHTIWESSLLSFRALRIDVLHLCGTIKKLTIFYFKFIFQWVQFGDQYLIQPVIILSDKYTNSMFSRRGIQIHQDISLTPNESHSKLILKITHYHAIFQQKLVWERQELTQRITIEMFKHYTFNSFLFWLEINVGLIIMPFSNKNLYGKGKN